MSTVLQSVIDRSEDQYPEFLEDIHDHFITSGGVPLFTTNVSGLFETFLEHLPANARQHYTCHACQHFIDRYGGLVTISPDGKTNPVMWGEVPPFFAPAIAALCKKIAKAQVNGVFVAADKTWGQPLTEGWQHMAVTPPANMIFRPVTQTAFQRMAELQEDFKTLTAGLLEFPVAAIDQALVLLKTDSLYRSEKCLGVAEWLKDLHTKRAATKNAAVKRNLTWLAVATAPPGFCHVKSTMIGTLLSDIVAGLSFDAVSQRFAAKMHPLQYQRPQAPPSAGNIAQAEKIMQQLNAAGALERRFARLDELQTIWKQEEQHAAKPVGEGVFAHLIPKGSRPTVQPIQAPPVVMTWNKFWRTVLPTAEAIEFHVGMGRDHYAAIVTAAHEAAPPILQWDREDRRNPFSWYVYTGGSTPERWNMTPGYHQVTAVCFQPSMWDADFDHQGKSVFFILAGAKDIGYQTSGNALFPATLKSEYHSIRATIEAFSHQAVLGGYEEASACGIRLQAGGTWQALFRVTAGGNQMAYQLDRWD